MDYLSIVQRPTKIERQRRTNPREGIETDSLGWRRYELEVTSEKNESS